MDSPNTAWNLNRREGELREIVNTSVEFSRCRLAVFAVMSLFKAANGNQMSSDGRLLQANDNGYHRMQHSSCDSMDRARREWLQDCWPPFPMPSTAKSSVSNNWSSGGLIALFASEWLRVSFCSNLNGFLFFPNKNRTCSYPPYNHLGNYLP